jgi:transglutaminase-like putative cysteine protease
MIGWRMILRVSADLNYDLRKPSTLLFSIKVGNTPGQRILNEFFYVDPPTEADHFDSFCGMNRCTRICPQEGPLHVRYQADVETQYRSTDPSSIHDSTLKSIPPDAMPFLFPSRYCQSDRFRSHALDLFGHLRSQYAIAQGVSDWIYNHVTYQPGTTTEQSSAIDTFEQRTGVCRDFAHLGIAMCRAMSLPARYASCYSHLLQPSDFHAIFEVLISGNWYAFDPTRLAPLNGIVRIATGRDGADTSICSMFGNPLLLGIEVICNARDNDFVQPPHEIGSDVRKAVSLL